MIRLLTLFLMVILGADAYAGTDKLRSVVVKTKSFLCGYPERTFTGSGMLLSFNGQTFVLTSEHVVLHSNTGYCHTIEHDRHGRHSAELIVADWGYGLALLKIAGLSIPEADLGLFNDDQLRDGDEVRLTGYPAGSHNLVFNNTGHVVSSDNTRRLTPLAPRMPLVFGAHGEFGMSGGPAFAQDGTLVGVLSHQHLSLTPGGRSTIQEFSAGAPVVENHLLLIPQETVRTFVERTLMTPASALPCFVREPVEHLEGRHLVLSSGLRFSMVTSDTDDGEGVGGSDGVGVGGSDGVGVGGSDGVGVGGSSKHGGDLSVKVTIDRSGRTTNWCLPEALGWLERTKKQLHTPDTVIEIPYFVRHDGDALTKVRVHSLADFFQKIAADHLLPVTLIDGPRDGKLVPQRVLEMQQLALEALQLSESLQADRDLGPRPRALLKKIRQTVTVLRTDQWPLVSQSKLRHLQESEHYTDAWGQLFNQNFTDAVDLHGHLNELIDQLLGLKVSEREEKE